MRSDAHAETVVDNACRNIYLNHLPWGSVKASAMPSGVTGAHNDFFGLGSRRGRHCAWKFRSRGIGVHFFRMSNVHSTTVQRQCQSSQEIGLRHRILGRWEVVGMESLQRLSQQRKKQRIVRGHDTNCGHHYPRCLFQISGGKRLAIAQSADFFQRRGRAGHGRNSGSHRVSAI